MSMFKKSSRKFRQRIKEDDSDEEKTDNKSNQSLKVENENENENLKLINTDDDDNKPNKVQSKKPSLKLSFHDEEDESEDVFKVKKSAYSRRLTKQLEKQKRKEETAKETTSVKIVKEIKEEKQDDNELNVIWVKSKNIPQSSNKIEEKQSSVNTNFENIQIISDSDENFDEDEKETDFHQFRGALKRGVIPDAKTIYALKKQRQMARETLDYIPLDEEEYDENELKMIRDAVKDIKNDEGDEDDDDEDDDDERISFAINKANDEKEKIKEAFYQAQEEEDDDETKDESDDELDRWEREQIRKGVGMPTIRLLAQEQINTVSINMDIDKKESKTIKKANIPSYIISKSKKVVSLDDIYNKVDEKLKAMKENLELYKRQIVNLEIEIKQAKDVLKNQNGQTKE